MITFNDKKYYLADEVAQLLGIKKRTLMKLVKLGKIMAFKPSERKTFFGVEQVQNYLEGK